jgi:hypothetical protein
MYLWTAELADSLGATQQVNTTSGEKARHSEAKMPSQTKCQSFAGYYFP